MDTDQRKAIAKEIKTLLINDSGIQASISNIRAQNSDPYRVCLQRLSLKTTRLKK